MPTARLMYMSATWLQVTNQFFASLTRFQGHRLFSGWQWLESEIKTPAGGFCFGRSSDVAGFVEGIHDQHGSPAGLLIDEAKSIRHDILDTLERCHTTFRLFMSSTGQAAGGFYRIMTAKAHLWKIFRVPSSDCPHVSKAEIVDAWRSRDTMHSTGKFLAHFRRLGLQGYDIGGDEGYGH